MRVVQWNDVQKQVHHARKSDTGDHQHELRDNCELVPKMTTTLGHCIPLRRSLMKRCTRLPSSAAGGTATSNTAITIAGSSQKNTTPGPTIADGRLKRSTIQPPTFHHAQADSVENTTPMAKEIATRNRRDSRSRNSTARA